MNNMPFCTNCGAQLKEGTRFCVQCGTPVKAPAATPAPAKEYKDIHFFVDIDTPDSIEEDLFIESKDINVKELLERNLAFILPYYPNKYKCEPVSIHKQSAGLMVYIDNYPCGTVPEKQAEAVQDLLASDKLDKITAFVSCGAVYRCSMGDDDNEFEIHVTNEDIKINVNMIVKK